MAEAWDRRVFGCNRRRRHRRRARRDQRTCQLLARRTHITPGIVAVRPTRVQHLKFLAVAKVEVAQPVHFAEFVDLPEASTHQLADGKDQGRPVDNRLAAGRDLQDRELVAAAGAYGSQPMRSAELKNLCAGRGNVLKRRKAWLSTGGTSASGATAPMPALRSESRPTLRRRPPRRGRRSRSQKARRDRRSSRTRYLGAGSLHIRLEMMLETAGEQEFRSVSKLSDASAASLCRAGDGRRASRSRAHKTFAER
jgi:hypothetical protein